jgi:hypothetical protein
MLSRSSLLTHVLKICAPLLAVRQEPPKAPALDLWSSQIGKTKTAPRPAHLGQLGPKWIASRPRRSKGRSMDMICRGGSGPLKTCCHEAAF